jgi:Zn-dependent metalloprotease
MAAIPSPTGKKHRLIYDAQHKPTHALPGKLVRSEGEKGSEDPKGPNGPSKDLAVNEAYDHSGDTYDFYKEIFNRNSLDDRGMSLISSVHVGKNYANAFWDGEQMAYGDGDGRTFVRFTKALDVVAHELTHGVVTHTANLDYQDEPGALNEHYADVMGILVKQWRRNQTVKQADWLIGDDILVKTPTRKALRSFSAPGTAYRNDPDIGTDPQPAHMKQKYEGKMTTAVSISIPAFPTTRSIWPRCTSAAKPGKKPEKFGIKRSSLYPPEVLSRPPHRQQQKKRPLSTAPAVPKPTL